MEDLSFLQEDAQNATPEQDSLAKLDELVKAYDLAKRKVEELEELLKDAKESFNKISQEEIPNLLLQNGLSQLKTQYGRKITIKQEVSPKITDMNEFSSFLEKRGESSLLKTTMELGKLDESIVNAIKHELVEKLGLYPEINRTIHPMTLKAFIKELCQLNVENPIEDDTHMNINELPSCISVYTFYKTAIK